MRGADQLNSPLSSLDWTIGQATSGSRGKLSDAQALNTVFGRAKLAIILAVFFTVLILDFAVFSATALAQSTGSAVGQVETLKGTATATRRDQSVVNLSIGTAIFQGDRLQTGRASTLGITFVDQTVFSLFENSQMEVNELVYNPGGSSNNMLLNLAEGSFVFLAGKMAATGDMRVDTPVAQMGLRGTLPWVKVGQSTSFTILSERDNTTGEYVLLRKRTGAVIATVNLATVGTTKKLVMNSPEDVPQTVDKTPEELRQEQLFKAEIFNTLTTRDNRLGLAPDQGPGGPPGGGNNPGSPPGDQGSAPGNGPAGDAVDAAAAAALIDQANVIVAACRRAQSKVNNALQRYRQGNNRRSRQLLQDAENDLRQLPARSCGNLLERVAGGLRTVDQSDEDARLAQAAINRCDEGEIDRLRQRFASTRQKNSKLTLASLEAAARNCARRRVQRDRARDKTNANAECRQLNGPGYYAGKVRADGTFNCRPTKKTANAWCRQKNGRGSLAGRIRSNGRFNCYFSRQERSRQAWAACRRQYGSRLADVKIFRNGKYRCIVQNVVRRPPPRPEQNHDTATSAAVIGGILGVIDGISRNRHKKSRSRGRDDRRERNTPRRVIPRQGINDHCKGQSIGGCRSNYNRKRPSGPCVERRHNRRTSGTYLRPCRRR